MSKQTFRVHKLDGLRGLFALMVVLYHFEREYLPFNLYDNFIIRNSHVFVDFFFVLSGFVIALNYFENLQKSNSTLHFLKKRIIRLYPLLLYSTIIFILYLTVTNLIKLFLVSPGLFENHKLIPIPSLIYNSLDTFLLTNSTPLFGESRGVNYPSWSISSEMISYFVFGLILVYVTRFKIFILALLTGISCIYLAYNGQYFATGQYGFVRGIIGFNFGVFVYFFYQKNFEINKFLEIFIIPGIVSLLYCLDLFKGSKNYLLLSFLIPLGFALSILVLVKTNYYLTHILETRLFQFLGRISYSIYLNHALLLFIIPKLSLRVLGLDSNSASLSVILLLTLIILITYSFFTYKIIEVQGGKLMGRLLIQKNLSIRALVGNNLGK